MKEQYVAKRVVNMILIFLVAIIFSCIAGGRAGFYPDSFLALASLTVLFVLLFLFLLVHDRNRLKLSNNRETDYRRVMVGFLCSALIALSFFLFPEFMRPVMLIPLLMSAVGTEELAFCSSFFFCSVFGLAEKCSEYEILVYIILIVFGCVIARMMENEKVKVWYLLLIFALSVVIPVIFFYFSYQETSYVTIFTAFIPAVLTDLFAIFLYPVLTRQKEQEISHMLSDMVEDEYFLLQELKKFSRLEYRHAIRVSITAGKCAQIVNADSAVCKAAGMYYRIGILDGDPMVEHGVKRAKMNCFPERVTEILSEYYGIEKKPSTIESAIVQMVDGLIKKMEALEKISKIENGWNKEMVIYQTLNEFSAQGLYDQSGLSMNMFLKIREYLVKEEALLL